MVARSSAHWPTCGGWASSCVKWDGLCVAGSFFIPCSPSSSTPRPLIDANGRIIAVLAGQPRNDAYRLAVERAFRAISDAAVEARFPASMRKHRRGLFAAMNVGLSYGKGQTTPCWLNNKEYTGIADSLLEDQDIGRMAGFADAAFALWAPRLYGYYPRMRRPAADASPPSPSPLRPLGFLLRQFQFWRNVWTFKHRDILNLAFGWCAIQALGRFDATKGGHLILWDLGLVVEFPAGALILVPSATIAHSNVPVQEGETRTSFTQFSPGGIFRYVDNGFRTVNQLVEEDPAEYERLVDLKEKRWEMGLDLFSTLEELLAPVAS
ncbi:hypothetical protein B0H14DRAFT_2420447 [Mycena olivaceomarginata]|nr:hypothetical protein B0H14DRAFT_2420447 [Mycena olivaceomarginata]